MTKFTCGQFWEDDASNHFQDGSRRSATISLETATIPRMAGYVRAFQDSIAFYKPLSAEKTKISIVCRIDLNDSDAADGTDGNFPMVSRTIIIEQLIGT